jgi:hypothetical protein
VPDYVSIKDYSSEEQEKINAPMSTRREALDLARKMKERFGPDSSVVVVNVPDGYVCHAIKKGYYPTYDDVGENELYVMNGYMWTLIS